MWKSFFSPKRLSPTVATMMIVLSTIGYGLVPLFAKTLINAGLASSAIAFYRNLLPALLFLPLLTFAPKKRSGTFWSISSGLLIGFGGIAYVEALKSAPVATVGVIYMTYLLFTLLIAALWLRQIPPLKSIFAGLLIVVAAFIALSPASLGTSSLKPLIFSLLAPLSFAYGIIVLTDKAVQLAPLERVAAVAFGATLGLLPLILSLDSSVVIPSRLADWMLILGIAIVTKIFPTILYNIAGPFAGSARTAVIGSLELPVMFVVGWLAFGEPITLLQSLAGFLVIMAIWMTKAKPSKNLSEEVEVEVKVKQMMRPTSVKSEA